MTAVGALVALALRGLTASPSDSRLAKECAFLASAALAASAYAVAHDELTATLSPEYFLLAKGLAGDPRPFRWAVAVLAVQASAWAGLLAGAALLVANNPRRGGAPPQLPYRTLAKLALLPVAVAAVTAAACGVVNASLQVGAGDAADLGVPGARVRAFAAVWAVHAGSYAGALLGTVAAVVLVVTARRRMLPGG